MMYYLLFYVYIKLVLQLRAFMGYFYKKIKKKKQKTKTIPLDDKLPFGGTSIKC